MQNYNTDDDFRGSGLIAGYSPDNPILRNPQIFPYWRISDAAKIFGYHYDHIHLLFREGKVAGFTGVTGRYVRTQSMLDYLARQQAGE